MSYQTEFPGFVGMPAIPAGFIDSSWRNDACPSFTNESCSVIIWVDFIDPADRELPYSSRFLVTPERGAELATDDWQAVLSFLSGLALAAGLLRTVAPG